MKVKTGRWVHISNFKNLSFDYKMHHEIHHPHFFFQLCSYYNFHQQILNKKYHHQFGSRENRRFLCWKRQTNSIFFYILYMCVCVWVQYLNIYIYIYIAAAAAAINQLSKQKLPFLLWYIKWLISVPVCYIMQSVQIFFFSSRY